MLLMTKKDKDMYVFIKILTLFKHLFQRGTYNFKRVQKNYLYNYIVINATFGIKID